MNIDILKADAFLKKHCMHPDNINLNDQLSIFINEMEKGLSGISEASMMMIPSYITLEGTVPAKEHIIVIDAGGTNLRIALVYFNEQRQSSIEYLKKYPMPGTCGSVTFIEMCDTIAGYIFPIINRSNRIALCFSFPAEILPDHDAKIIAFNKEIQIYEAEGRILGEGLYASLQKLGVTERKHFIVLNDAIATLLGAVAAYPGRPYDSYIGFILGTGTNICYVEQTKKISKLHNTINSGNLMVINTESGGYNKIPRGTIDIKIDNESMIVGDMVLEKMISGAYQCGLILQTMQLAAREGLFSKSFSSRLRDTDTLPIGEIATFYENPFNESFLAKLVNDNNSDRRILYTIIDRIYERAAKITTLMFAGIVKKTGYGHDPTVPLCISAEGTTFEKSKIFRNKLLYHVKDFINDELGFYVEFVKVADATIIGSAVAGLLN